MKKFIFAAFAASTFSLAAHAALGQPPASIARDGTPQNPAVHEFAAAPGPALPPAVQSQTVLTDRGVTVREFYANNTVFAITWNGPVMPDLSQLMGTFFPQYQLALQNRPAGRRNAPVTIQTDQIVVRAFGHMRAFSGSAYVPALVPAGFDVSSLGAP